MKYCNTCKHNKFKDHCPQTLKNNQVKIWIKNQYWKLNNIPVDPKEDCPGYEK